MEGMKKMKTYKALALVTALLSICPSLHAIDIRIGDTRAAKIAKDAHLPGKGVEGQCLPFASALHEKFEAAGIPSKVIVYGYEASAAPGLTADSGSSSQAGTRSAHAVVAYNDGGRTYIMDNQSWAPQWIHNAAPMQMAQQFSGINANVRIARVMNDAKPVNIMAPAFSGVQIAAK